MGETKCSGNCRIHSKTAVQGCGTKAHFLLRNLSSWGCHKEESLAPPSSICLSIKLQVIAMSGVRPVIYVGDILMQAKSLVAPQSAISQLEVNSKQLVPVVNENKTNSKYQCWQHRDATLLMSSVGVPLKRAQN